MFTLLDLMPSKRSSRAPRRGRRGGGGPPRPTLTSVPTGRAAYEETRQWLLKTHGPICAYCEKRVHPGAITLDHVTPRRGQTAYDRRDNLVLACKTCNGAKADKSILAFLLGNRTRALNLFKYGQHLSPMLVEMVLQLVQNAGYTPPPVVATAAQRKKAAEIWAEPDDGVSPYKDESPYAD